MHRHLTATWALLSLACWSACTGDPDAGDPVHLTVEPGVLPTVLQVAWSTGDGTTAGEGWVEFGHTEEMERHTAGVLGDDGVFRASLVALAPSSPVLLRGVIQPADEDIVTGRTTVTTTGAAPSWLASMDLAERDEGAAEGLVVTSLLSMPSTAVIIDTEGRYLWWHRLFDDGLPETHHMITRAAPSRDGRSVLYMAWTMLYPEGPYMDDRDVVRLALDGSSWTAWRVAGAHHDLVELPDGTIAVLAFDPREVDGTTVIGDRIVELSPDGRQRTVWSVWDHASPSPEEIHGDDQDWSHANALDYDDRGDRYLVSMRNLDSIWVVDRDDGSVAARYGGEDATHLLTDGTPTDGQHQFQLLEDGLLVFDNGVDGSATSRAVEYRIDDDAGTMTEVWSHVSDPPLGVYSIGDVSRLDGGQTLITWSTAGQMDQVTEGGDLLWRVNLELGEGFGYSTWLPEWPD